MQRFRVWGTVCLVVWSMGWNAVSTTFAAPPADAVPDSASFVVRWKTPQATLAKLGEFVDAVQPGMGNVATSAGLTNVGSAFGNPRLAGVDTNQDWWLIGFAESGSQPPSIVYMVTAKNVDALKDAVSDDYETHVADKLVIYSRDEDALARVRDQLKGNGATLWSKTDAATKKVFDGTDLSVLVNVRQLTEEFESELNEAEPQMEAFFDQMSNFIPEEQRAQMQVAFDMYRGIGKAALQGVRDSNALALGFSFSKSAIRYESTLQVNKETQTAGYLSKQPVSALPIVSQLPPNQSAYFGFRGDMKGFMEWAAKVNKELMKGASIEDSAKLEAALKEMAGLKFEDMAGYFDVASAAPAIRYGAVSMVTPTKRMRELSLVMLKSMSKMEFPGFTQTTKVEPGVDKINGVEFDRITVKQEIDGAMDSLGLQTKIRKILLGEEGMQQLVMYQPTRSLQVLGGKSDLQTLLTGLDAKPATGSPVTAARQRLSEKANIIVLADIARMILNGAQLAASDGDLPIDVAALEGLKLDSSFFGFSLTCEPTAIRSQVDIPLTQIQNIVKVVMPLVRPAQ